MAAVCKDKKVVSVENRPDQEFEIPGHGVKFKEDPIYKWMVKTPSIDWEPICELNVGIVSSLNDFLKNHEKVPVMLIAQIKSIISGRKSNQCTAKMQMGGKNECKNSGIHLEIEQTNLQYPPFQHKRYITPENMGADDYLEYRRDDYIQLKKMVEACVNPYQVTQGQWYSQIDLLFCKISVSSHIYVFNRQYEFLAEVDDINGLYAFILRHFFPLN